MELQEYKDMLFFSIVIEKNKLGFLQKAELITYQSDKNNAGGFSFSMISCDVDKVKGDVDTAITEELNLMKSKHKTNYDMFFLTKFDEIIDMDKLLPKSYNEFKELEIINFDAIQSEIVETYSLDPQVFVNNTSPLGAKLQQINYVKFLMEAERNKKGIYSPPF